MSWLWLIVIGAPLLWAMVHWSRPGGALSGLWLSAVPALLASFWSPDPLSLTWLWPGSQWGVDSELRRYLLALTAIIWGGVGVCAASGTLRASLPGRSWWFWPLVQMGNLSLVLSLDGPGFYAGFALMSLSAYGLVLHRGGEQARRGSRTYLQWAILSEMLIYAGLMLRIHEAGGILELSLWRSIPAGPWTAALLLAGFGIKLGVWPLHLWLPRAYPVAPPVVCALLSGTMMKAGVLGLWLFMPATGDWMPAGGGWLLVIAAVSAFYGVALGLGQTEVRKVLACSSISQAGYLFAILVLAWHQPAHSAQWGVLLALFAVHHGLAKAALFLGAGLSSTAPLRPLQWLLMMAPALSLAGVPLTTGAAVKTQLEKGVVDTVFSPWVSLLTLGSLATALLMWWALWCLYRDRAHAGPRAPPALLYPWVLLCAASLVLPWTWSAMREPFLASLEIAKLWSLAWPALLAVGVMGAVLKSGLRRPSFPRYAFRGLDSARLLRSVPRLALPSLSSPPRSGGGRWRRVERFWNRLLGTSTIVTSMWLLCLLLLVGWVLW